MLLSPHWVFSLLRRLTFHINVGMDFLKTCSKEEHYKRKLPSKIPPPPFSEQLLTLTKTGHIPEANLRQVFKCTKGNWTRVLMG